MTTARSVTSPEEECLVVALAPRSCANKAFTLKWCSASCPPAGLWVQGSGGGAVPALGPRSPTPAVQACGSCWRLEDSPTHRSERSPVLLVQPLGQGGRAQLSGQGSAQYKIDPPVSAWIVLQDSVGTKRGNEPGLKSSRSPRAAQTGVLANDLHPVNLLLLLQQLEQSKH